MFCLLLSAHKRIHNNYNPKLEIKYFETLLNNRLAQPLKELLLMGVLRGNVVKGEILFLIISFDNDCIIFRITKGD